MINTYLELLEQTLAKYEGATALSYTMSDDGGEDAVRNCVYSHDANGVGCAIGCHLPSSLANEMDESLYLDIGTVILVDNERNHELHNHLNVDGIGEDNLERLQRMHDRCDTVDEFRQRLRTAIAAEKQRNQ